MRHPDDAGGATGPAGSKPRAGAARVKAWRPTQWWAVAALVVAAAAGLWVGLVLAPAEQARSMGRWRDQLSAMADDRSSAVERWVGERFGDARYVAAMPSVVASVGEHGGSDDDRRRTDAIMQLVAVQADYLSAVVLAADGRRVAGFGETEETNPADVELARQCMRAGHPLTVFHLRDGTTPVVHFVVPVVSASAAPIGAVLLTADPTSWLYPFLAHQPVPTATGETALIEREGGDAVFLTPLRFSAAAPLTLRRPLSTPGFAAAVALGGGAGFSQYVDYRGVPVLVSARSIRGTPWGLVVKVDREEALAPYRRRLAEVAAGLAVLLLAAAGLVYGVWSRTRLRARAAAAEALRLSEARQRAFFDASVDGVFVKDAAFRTVMANAAYGAILGRTVAEVLGHDDFEVMPEGMARACRESDLEALRTGASRVAEESVSDRVFETRKFPVPLPDGSMGVGGYIRDITEHKRVEEALRESEERFRTMADSLPQLAWIAKADGFIYWYNRRWFDYTGTTPSQMEGWGWQSVHDPTVLPRVLEQWQGSIATGRPFDMEFPLRGADGTFRPFLTRVMPLKDAQGKVLQWFGTNTDITERKQAEATLQASEVRYRRLFESAKDGILIVNAETGAIEDVNPFLADLLGYAHDELVGRKLWEIGPFKDIVASRDAFTRLQQTGYNRYEDLPLEAKDGRRANVEFVSNTYEVDHTVVVQCNIRDITERKRGEEALHESEARYRGLFEQSPLGIYRTTPDGTIVAANPALLRLLGYASFEELASRNLELDGYEPGYLRQEFKERVERDGEVIGFESAWLRKDGRIVEVRESARAVRDSSGRMLHYEGTVEDVTEVKRGERERTRLVAAIEQAAETVVITDTDGRIEYANPAFERITGYTLAEAVGQRPSILKSGRQDEAFYAALWRTITGGGTWHGHFVNKRKDGTLYEEDATISPIRDAGGGIVSFVAVKRDVTQEVELAAQLNQAQKMEAVGSLAGGVAHDFNNLLQVLLSQIQLLQTYADDPERVRALGVELGQQVSHGALLTRQLLLFSRRETAKTERLDLNESVRSATTMLRRLVRANIALEVKLTPDALLVNADRGHLEQVLMNLALNASDAMPGGGTLTLRTATGESGWVCLTVEDTGAGIPEAIRERIFDPFFTTKEAGKGTGLGLSVVHGIVTSYGGRIEVESVEGQGSVFRVILPAVGAGEVPAAQEVPKEAEGLPEGHGERILIVEDEDAAREALRDILGNLGYEVVAAASGEEAGLLPAEEPFAVLLTDLMLPGVGGAQLVDGLRDRWPSLRVILMSGYAEDEVTRRGIAKGTVRFLQKPFDIAALAREIRAVLADTIPTS